MESLVSTDWLAAELGAADLRLLDATAFLPGSGRDARADYEAGHIPGAIRFDLEEVSDPSSPLPHSWPPAHVFASRMRALGVGDHDRIVIYDNSPLHTSARAWWMLRSFGARHVAILASQAKQTGRDPDEIRAARMKSIPAGRMGEPAEFGAACAFLCSAQAGYITGQSLLIDGGAFPGIM